MNANQSLEQGAAPRLALEKRIAKTMLQLHPGLGPVAQEQAALLAESGLSPVQCAQIVEAVYAPAGSGPTAGLGQTQRAKWMVQALRERYASRLERCANNTVLFRQLVADLEKINENRDTVNGEGVGFSFHDIFLLDEIGLGADAILGMMQDIGVRSRLSAKMRLMEAARRVKAGQFATIEGALFQGAGARDHDWED